MFHAAYYLSTMIDVSMVSMRDEIMTGEFVDETLTY